MMGYGQLRQGSSARCMAPLRALTACHTRILTEHYIFGFRNYRNGAVLHKTLQYFLRITEKLSKILSPSSLRLPLLLDKITSLPVSVFASSSRHRQLPLLTQLLAHRQRHGPPTSLYHRTLHSWLGLCPDTLLRTQLTLAPPQRRTTSALTIPVPSVVAQVALLANETTYENPPTLCPPSRFSQRIPGAPPPALTRSPRNARRSPLRTRRWTRYPWAFPRSRRSRVNCTRTRTSRTSSWTG